MKTIRTLMATVACAVLAHAPAQAFCGFYAGKADANLFNETSQVVLARDGKRTVLTLLNDYKGPLKAFALVVPTPTTLKKGQVRLADKQLFERLDAFSSPRLVEHHDADPCQLKFGWGLAKHGMEFESETANESGPTAPAATARNPALGVTVETQYRLGEYDIVSLSATDSEGLETWLHKNGYTLPKGASAALRPYIQQGMKFFVAKVNVPEQAKTGTTTLRPLQFAFESEKFLLPLRLGLLNAPPDKAQELVVYALTRQGRVESSNYRTVKLSAGVNLPFFIKPQFQDFYQALFDQQAGQEQQRAVFTEYFGDAASCEPCAADPLSRQELRDAGAFWVDGDADALFESLRAPAGTPMPWFMTAPAGGEQEVLVTRLHVRYSATTFPEDLLLTQTRDRESWQALYVVRQPFDSNLAACSSTLAQTDCDALCKQRIATIPKPREDSNTLYYHLKSPAEVQSDCVAACTTAKQSALQTAVRYYQQSLPERLRAEKQTLADLTGWSPARIAQLEQLPALHLSYTPDKAVTVKPAPVKPVSTRWQRLRDREDQP